MNEVELAYRYALWEQMSGADWRVRPGSGAPIVDLAASPHWQTPHVQRRIMYGDALQNQPIVGAVHGRSPTLSRLPHHKRAKHEAVAGDVVGWRLANPVPVPPESRGPRTLSVGRGGRGGGGRGLHAAALGGAHAAPLHVPPMGHLPGHGHHGRRRFGFGFGGWGGPLYGNWWDGYPVLLATCPDGTVVLPDGTCADLSELDYEGAAQGAPTPRAVVGQYDAGGYQTPSDSSGLVPGQIDPTTGTTYLGPGGSGGSTPLGPGVTGGGSTGSGNAEADALNLEWIALEQAVPACLGANATMPATGIFTSRSTSFSEDDSKWRAFYAQVPLRSAATDMGPYISAFGAVADLWADLVRAKCPNAQLPPNFPPGTGVQAVANAASAAVAAVASGFEWAIVAALVVGGIWLLWPIIVPTLAKLI